MYLNKIKTTISFFLILSVISINKFAFAEIIKPNNGIEPLQVVKIQLRGLKNNSKEYKDDGSSRLGHLHIQITKDTQDPLRNLKLC